MRRYAEGDKVAMNVGFYYMANAMGRLVGELCWACMHMAASMLGMHMACTWHAGHAHGCQHAAVIMWCVRAGGLLFHGQRHKLPRE